MSYSDPNLTIVYNFNENKDIWSQFSSDLPFFVRNAMIAYGPVRWKLGSCADGLYPTRAES